MRALRQWDYTGRDYYLVVKLDGDGAPRVVHEGFSSVAAARALAEELRGDGWAYLYACHRVEGPVEDIPAAERAGATFPTAAVAVEAGRVALDEAAGHPTADVLERRALEHALDRNAR